MTDKELLELAARAAGFKGYIHEWINGPEFIIPGENPITWNPLTDDGDALRLAVKLGIQIHFEGDDESEAVWANDLMLWIDGGDTESATRRAITRAAAEIQLQKEKSE